MCFIFWIALCLTVNIGRSKRISNTRDLCLSTHLVAIITLLKFDENVPLEKNTFLLVMPKIQSKCVRDLLCVYKREAWNDWKNSSGYLPVRHSRLKQTYLFFPYICGRDYYAEFQLRYSVNANGTYLVIGAVWQRDSRNYCKLAVKANYAI